MTATTMHWLPSCPDFAARHRAARAEGIGWDALVGLSRHDLDGIETGRVARLRRERFPDGPPEGSGTRPVRLALLGSCTLDQLEAGIVAGALRRGLWAETFHSDYGQYLQDLVEPGNALEAFAPTHLLFAFDAATATARAGSGGTQAENADAFLDHLAMCWRRARARFPEVSILQQSLIPRLPRTLGGNEHRFAGSPAGLLDRINARLGDACDAAGVTLLDLGAIAAGRDPATWYDPLLWVKAKQEVTGLAAPLYGDLVGRILGAEQGRSGKCLVLDLDNTLWGGVIGDDGLEGIVLGQGSAAGEAFLSVQAHARALSRRGVILAVCSKNDESNARLPFEQHPDMLLRAGDFAAFVANWGDKASNLREIAGTLNIGLDSLVFLDDNPFERNQVRAALPMVSVPEPGEEPGLYAACLSDGGYFEALSVTGEDVARAGAYAANAERARARDEAGDISAYLAGLGMRLAWHRFRAVDHERTVQLINKTNQFNLTTRRYTGADVTAVADDPRAFGLTFRLSDSFGDNGIIAVVVGRIEGTDAVLDLWLMSCRVLGRGVETATLEVVAAEAARLGATRLVGDYVASAKNAMVRDHYTRLGFAPAGTAPGGGDRAVLDIATRCNNEHHLTIEGPDR